eukprot:4841282-Amphidinium_carterae.1
MCGLTWRLDFATRAVEDSMALRVHLVISLSLHEFGPVGKRETSIAFGFDFEKIAQSVRTMLFMELQKGPF